MFDPHWWHKTNPLASMQIAQLLASGTFWVFSTTFQPWPKFVILLLYPWPNGCERVAVHTERRSSKSRSRNVNKFWHNLKRHDFIFKLMLSLSVQINKWVWLSIKSKNQAFLRPQSHSIYYKWISYTIYSKWKTTIKRYYCKINHGIL